jgi:hypothetical protein
MSNSRSAIFRIDLVHLPWRHAIIDESPTGPQSQPTEQFDRWSSRFSVFSFREYHQEIHGFS